MRSEEQFGSNEQLQDVPGCKQSPTISSSAGEQEKKANRSKITGVAKKRHKSQQGKTR